MKRSCYFPFLAGLMFLAATAAGQDAPATTRAQQSRGDAFETTVKYVEQFYPLWFTYYQTLFAHSNLPVGPENVTPIYHYVVAINVDTLYVSSYLNLSRDPVILTIPNSSPNLSYSVLMLDPYGDKISQSAITPPAPGTFALYGPGFKGTLPTDVTPVPLPLNHLTVIFRVDKFANGVDLTSEADSFRRAVRTEPLCAYLGQACPPDTPPGGVADIVPGAAFAFPFKTTADTLIARDPIFFLRMLQIAVLSKKTPKMSADVQELSDEFNALFRKVDTEQSEFARGTRAAHHAIVHDYLDNTGPTNWITYTNIGIWAPDEYIQRSSITEFIQYANNHAAAAYYHAFKDGDGLPLDGTDPDGYVLKFSAKEIPVAKRFWSLTAYTPEAIELVRNSADKYVVASYTPGLETNQDDGSISIYMARQLPPGINPANWLPIPSGPFNIMLRVYGPEGDVENNTYVPPAITKAH